MPEWLGQHGGADRAKDAVMEGGAIESGAVLSAKREDGTIEVEGVGRLREGFVRALLVGFAEAARTGSLPIDAGAQPKAPFAFGSAELLWAAVERGLDRRRGADGYSRKTITAMKTATNSLRGFLREGGEEERLLRGDVREQRAVIEGWTGYLRASGKTHDTVSNYWRSLKSAFAAVAEREGMYSPFAGLRAPRPGQRRIRAVPREALHRAYDYLLNRQCRTELERLRDLAVFALAAMGGLRNGEIRRVAVSEVDVESGTIRITKSKGRFGGKDRAAQVVSDAIPILRAYSAARARAKRTHREFITSVARDRPLSEKALLGIFRRIEAAGVVVRPHMCRHTFNVILESAGVRDAARMELLGHTRLSALQYYTHAFAGEAAAAARGIHLGLDTRSLPDASREEGNAGRSAGEIVTPDTRVAHGRDDAGVASERLDDVDRCAPLQKHRDEGMP